MQKPIEITHLSRVEKLMVTVVIWDDLTHEEESLESPEWHKLALQETENRLATGENRTPKTIRMKIRLLSSSLDDVIDGRLFYEKQGEELGEYFFDSLFSDIDSLTLYGGVHPKIFGYHRMVVQKISLCHLLQTCGGWFGCCRLESSGLAW
jgi:Putative addiction module component